MYSYSLHHPDQEGKISVQKRSKADFQSCVSMSVLSRYNSFHCQASIRILKAKFLLAILHVHDSCFKMLAKSFFSVHKIDEVEAKVSKRPK